MKNAVLRALGFALMALFGVCLNAVAENLPGTEVTLQPPAGFVAADGYPGYVWGVKGASIMVTQIAGPYSESVKVFDSPRVLRKKGMEIVSRQDLRHDGMEAVLLQIRQPVNGTVMNQWSLVFGDAGETIFVNATYPAEFESELSAATKEAIRSAKWNKPGRRW